MTIRMFDVNQDIDDFIELYKISFGKTISKEYFKWKFLMNPFNMNINPITVVEENGKVVGVRCDVFGRMMINGTMIYTTLGADSMVHPDFRGKGTQVALAGIAGERYRDSLYKLHYTFSNYMSLNNLIRAGRQPICMIIWHCKVLNPREALNKMFQNPVIQKTGSLLSTLSWHISQIPNMRNQIVTVKEVTDMAILEDVYNQWQKTETNKIYTIRDRKYLNWRFNSHPEIEYKFLAAYIGPEVKGYFVISLTEFRTMKRGTIADYLIIGDDPKIFEPLLNYSLKLFKNNNCILADIWVFTQKWARPVVEDYCFISSRNIFIRHLFSKSYLLASPWGEQDFASTLASTEWYITQSDTDSF